MAAILISAAHKSSGKTIVSIGLCAALDDRGYTVQPFKKGPDYIDPLWLSQAAGRDCLNLDFNTMTPAQIRAVFIEHLADADLGIIEGNKGLYDGVSVDGSDCNAELAKLLDVPVIMIFDAQGITRGVAPLLLGYQAFDPGVRIKGVILNKVAGDRHEAKLRGVVERYTDIPVLGAIPRDPRLAITERHLGLVPSNESLDVDARITGVREVIAQHVDVERIRELGDRAVPPPAGPRVVEPITGGEPVTVGVAVDAAFGFYYPDDLRAFADAGANLVYIDTLNDASLPELDGLFIGGGFPETQIHALGANTSLRRDIREFIEAGGPVYAECGGLMYLSRRIIWADARVDMVGALPLAVEMQPRPVGRGYVRISETGLLPWGPISHDGARIPAHEFHYSRPVEVGDGLKFAFRVHRGHGFDGANDGLIHRNVVAGFTHLRSIHPVQWVQRFTEFVRQRKRRR